MGYSVDILSKKFVQEEEIINLVQKVANQYNWEYKEEFFNSFVIDEVSLCLNLYNNKLEDEAEGLYIYIYTIDKFNHWKNEELYPFIEDGNYHRVMEIGFGSSISLGEMVVTFLRELLAEFSQFLIHIEGKPHRDSDLNYLVLHKKHIDNFTGNNGDDLFVRVDLSELE